MSEHEGTEDREEQTTHEQDEEQPVSETKEPEDQHEDGGKTKGDDERKSDKGRERGMRKRARERREGQNKVQACSTTEPSKRQKQFVAEFNRLKASLEKEATKIVKPEFQEYTPYIHTSLAPYCNTYTVKFLLNLPQHVRHGYTTRKTAIGLVDPEVSHNMDVNVDKVPASVPIPVTSINPDLMPKHEGFKGGKEGSTRLPKWPVVKFQKTEDANKKLNWGDVPRLRDTLKNQYSSNAQDRIKNDYQRTKQDWDRMELDKLRDIHEVNRSHMRITCGTYLGTSPGSNKAIKSLTKILE